MAARHLDDGLRVTLVVLRRNLKSVRNCPITQCYFAQDPTPHGFLRHRSYERSVLAVIFGAFTLCLRIYEAYRHLEVVNQHRVNIGRTFEAFKAAQPTDGAKEIMAAMTAENMLTFGKSGFAGKDSPNQGPASRRKRTDQGYPGKVGTLDGTPSSPRRFFGSVWCLTLAEALAIQISPVLVVVQSFLTPFDVIPRGSPRGFFPRHPVVARRRTLTSCRLGRHCAQHGLNALRAVAAYRRSLSLPISS